MPLEVQVGCMFGGTFFVYWRGYAVSIAERCGRCMLAWGASLRSGRNKIGGTLVRGCGKIYDSHLTCMEKPCIMIDKELLLFKCYILVKLINICYTHKEKRQWQKLEL